MLEIFRGGRVETSAGEALTFTAADLEAIAAGYDPAKHEAPLVVGHPTNDDPAYGWVKGLRVAGEALVAEVDQVDPAFKELVEAGRYKKISASFYRPDAASNPTPGKWHLRHVGFLGAVPPAIKGLRPVQFAGGAEGVVNFECTPRAQPKEQAMDLADREAALAERERKARRHENTAFVDGLVATGRLAPGHKPEVLDLMDNLDATQTVEFGEGAYRRTGTLLGHFKDWLGTLPKVIEFAELAGPDGGSIKGRDPAAIAQAAVTFQEEQAKAGKRVSAADAVRHVMGSAAS
jgi:hypothetical protein